MRCLLIATNKVRTPYPVYPLALACLAGALIEAGHKVEQFDCMGQQEDVDQELAAAITRFAPDLVGLSIRNLDSEDSSRPESFLNDAIQIMEMVRNNTASPIVIGGAAFSLMPEHIMELLQADYGIVGEGEALIVELADALSNNKLSGEKILRAPLFLFSLEKSLL